MDKAIKCGQGRRAAGIENDHVCCAIDGGVPRGRILCVCVVVVVCVLMEIDEEKKKREEEGKKYWHTGTSSRQHVTPTNFIHSNLSSLHVCYVH